MFEVSTPPFLLSVAICLFIYIVWLRGRSQREKDWDWLTGDSMFALVPLFFLSVFLMVIFQLLINLYLWVFN